MQEPFKINFLDHVAIEKVQITRMGRFSNIYAFQ